MKYSALLIHKTCTFNWRCNNSNYTAPPPLPLLFANVPLIKQKSFTRPSFYSIIISPGGAKKKKKTPLPQRVKKFFSLRATPRRYREREIDGALFIDAVTSRRRFDGIKRVSRVRIIIFFFAVCYRREENVESAGKGCGPGRRYKFSIKSPLAAAVQRHQRQRWTFTTQEGKFCISVSILAYMYDSPIYTYDI